jgi:uncharacterized protein (TIGR00369 family)
MTAEAIDLKQLLESSPFHRWLGLELISTDGEVVTFRLAPRAEFVGDPQRNTVHGGIISSLADIAGSFAVIQAIGQDVPTLDLRIDFLRWASATEPLVARARSIKTTRSVGWADVEVWNNDRLVAVARGAFPIKGATPPSG